MQRATASHGLFLGLAMPAGTDDRDSSGLMRMIMKRSITWRLTVAAALTMSAAAAMAAGNAQEGEIKARGCTGCHGIPGYFNVYPTYRVPKVGGQKEGYIVAALKAYKSGDRTHATMQAQAESLSDKDIADIAAYFASFAKP